MIVIVSGRGIFVVEDAALDFVTAGRTALEGAAIVADQESYGNGIFRPQPNLTARHCRIVRALAVPTSQFRYLQNSKHSQSRLPFLPSLAASVHSTR